MFTIKDLSKKQKIILFSLLFVYLMINLITIFKYKEYLFLKSDDGAYTYAGKYLIDHGMLIYHYDNVPTSFIMPGTPVIFGIFYWLVHDEWRAIMLYRIMQCFLQTYCLYLMFVMSKEFFNKYVGYIAVILSLFYFPDFQTSGLILTEIPFKLSFILLVKYSYLAIKSKEVKNYIIGGIWLTVTMYFRPVLAPYPIVILVIWIIEKYSIKEMVKFASITIVTVCLCLTPWWIRNYNTFNRFIIFTESSGDPFLLGTYINYEKDESYNNIVNDSKYNITVDGENVKDVPSLDKGKKELGIQRIKDEFKKDPLGLISWYTYKKTEILWRNPFLWKPVYNLNYSVYEYHGYIGMFALIGILVALRSNFKKHLFLFLTLAFYNCIYLPFFCFDRYNYPAMWILIIFAASLIWKIFKGNEEYRGELREENMAYH